MVALKPIRLFVHIFAYYELGVMATVAVAVWNRLRKCVFMMQRSWPRVVRRGRPRLGKSLVLPVVRNLMR